MKVKVIIECNKDGYYTAYPDTDMPLGVLGCGDSAEECAQDFLQCWKEEQTFLLAENKVPPLVEFDFYHDISAVLHMLPAAILSKLTGINERQLSHYKSGIRHPKHSTTAKIQTAMQEYAALLAAIKIA